MSRHWNLDRFVSAVLLVSCFFAASGGFGGAEAAALPNVTGIVKDDAGKPVRGAFVSALTASGFKRTSVFTNAAGRYRIANVKPQAYMVSAYGWGWETKEVSKNITGDVEVNFTLAPKWDPDLMMSTAEWFSSVLPWNKDTVLTFDCLEQCHGPSYILHEKGMRGKTAKDWDEGFMFRMDRYSGIDFGTHRALPVITAERVAILEKYFGPNAALPQRKQVQHREPDDAALGATFWEYKPRTHTVYIHSADADPNGNIWFAMHDKQANKIGRIDPRTDEMVEIPTPDPGIDSGPHTVIAGRGGQVNASGLIFISSNIGNRFGVIDPKTNQYTELKPMTGGMPHGIAVDSAGNVWTTHGPSEIGGKILKYDVKTKKLSEYAIPGGPAPRPAGWESNLFFQVADRESKLEPSRNPNGFGSHSNCIDPEDKTWLSITGGAARFDPITQQTKFFPIPGSFLNKGMACAPDGNIWIDSNTDHKIVKLNPSTGEMKFFPMPTTFGDPYGNVLDIKRGKLWVADQTAGSMVRLDLKTEQMTEYPIPDRYARPRFIGLDPQGRVVFGETTAGRVGMLDPGDLQ